MRWGLYSGTQPRMWAVSGPTPGPPSWWPYVWAPRPGLELYRTGVCWEHEPSNDEVAAELRLLEEPA
jgi:hypothetical protein